MDVFRFSFDVQSYSKSFDFDASTPSAKASVQAWHNSLNNWHNSMYSFAAEKGGIVDWGAETWGTYTVATGARGKSSPVTFHAGDTTATVKWKEITSAPTSETVVWSSEDKIEFEGLKELSRYEFMNLFEVSATMDETTFAVKTTVSWNGGSLNIEGLYLSSDDDFFEAATTNGWFI